MKTCFAGSFLLTDNIQHFCIPCCKEHVLIIDGFNLLTTWTPNATKIRFHVYMFQWSGHDATVERNISTIKMQSKITKTNNMINLKSETSLFVTLDPHFFETWEVWMAPGPNPPDRLLPFHRREVFRVILSWLAGGKPENIHKNHTTACFFLKKLNIYIYIYLLIIFFWLGMISSCKKRELIQVLFENSFLFFLSKIYRET